jgi:hypothetical protein
MKKSAVLILFVFIFSVVRGQDMPTREDSLAGYFMNNEGKLDPIEGIWSVSATQETYHFDTLFNVSRPEEDTRVAIIKQNDNFERVHISGDSLRVTFYSTDVKGVYLYENDFPQLKTKPKKQAVICKAGQMEYTYDLPEEYIRKISGVNYRDGLRIVRILRWTQTAPQPQK